MGTPPTTPTLAGTHVRLEPLQAAHASELGAAAALDPDGFAYMSQSPLEPGPDEYVQATLVDQAAGRCIAFAVVDPATGTAVGSTRFGDLDSGHPRCEIGWTWLAPTHRGGRVNAEMKLLMCEYAFEKLGCERVAIKTDVRNVRGQRAVASLGFVREGVLRRHMVANDGYLRDTVYYSVIRPEWPQLREQLTARAGRGGAD